MCCSLRSYHIFSVKCNYCVKQQILLVCEITPFLVAFNHSQFFLVIALHVEDGDAVGGWHLRCVSKEEWEGDCSTIVGTNDYFLIQ